MRAHILAVGWIHVVAGLFVFSSFSVLWIAAAQLAPMFEGSFIPELFRMFGRPVFIPILAVAAVQIVAAAAFLLGHGWPRLVLLAVSALLIVVFPIGTAIAVYSFWVLLQSRPRER